MVSKIFRNPRGIPVGIAVSAPIGTAVFQADVPTVHAVTADPSSLVFQFAKLNIICPAKNFQ